MADPWRLHLVVATDKANHLGSTICFRQRMVEQKSWATVTKNIKAILEWKFWIQDLFHEPEVLPVSFALLVARMVGLMQKVRKESTHTLKTTLSQFL